MLSVPVPDMILAAHPALVRLVLVLQAVSLQVRESVAYAVKTVFSLALAPTLRVPVLTGKVLAHRPLPAALQPASSPP